MQAELGGCPGVAASPQIVGGRADDHANGCQAARDEAGIGEPADADGHIEPLLEQVDDPIVQRHVDADLGIERQIVGKCRRQVHRSEAHRRVDLERTSRPGAGLAGLALGLVEIIQELPARS